MLRVAEHAERTDTGRQRRANEDAFLARAPLFAVADGMGGAQAGEVASRTAVETLAAGLPAGPGGVEERLAEVVRTANLRIHELSVADDERAGMGTTLTVAHVGPHELTIAHVGDSRAYRRRDGVLERLTTDHSLVEELVRQGRLSPEEAEEHPQRSIITRALGPEAHVVPDAHTLAGRDGDVLLLCSDGLTSMLPEARINELLGAAPDLRQAARDLVDAANAAGGRDNITVVLLRLEELEGAGGDAPDEATRVGAAALRVEDVQRAMAQAPPPEPAPEPEAPAAARAPLPPRSADPPPRRRRRIPAGAIVALVVTLMVLASLFIASRAVYFVGVGDDGFVTLYRGVPWELPGNVDLYEEVYASGVSTAQLTPRQRITVTEHELRSREDADDLVRQLELGRLTQ
jgi:protein phosphatase